MSGNESSSDYFTKYLFRTGCNCPTKLYYKARPSIYPEREEALPFIAHIRYNKRQLRLLLERLYPQGKRVAHGDREHMAEETAQLLEQDYTVIYNAAFLYRSLFSRVPLLEKDGERVRIYNLQTKAFDPQRYSMTNRQGRIHSKWIDYLRDFAYQLLVIKKLYPHWKLEPYLVLPDKTATAPIDNLDQKLVSGVPVEVEDMSDLLAFVPVIDQINAIWDGREPLFDDRNDYVEADRYSFEEIVLQLSEWYFSGEKKVTDVGKKCGNCEFRVDPMSLGQQEISGFEECWKDVLEEKNGDAHIFDLIGAGNGELLQDKIFLQHEIPLEEKIQPEQIARSKGRITDHHRRILQIAKAKGRKVPDEIIKPQLLDEIQDWEFPLHFLDFEAGSFAVPIRAGKKPYHQVVFQFSCHTLHGDGSLHHHQWVHRGDDSYPNYELVAELKKIPGILSGTIVHYSGFERSALRRIRGELQQESDRVPGAQDLIQWLEKVVGGKGTPSPQLADLGHLVKNYYYNAEMKDSLSIKDVLLSVMKISPVLKERFSRPYSSNNFTDIVWWQQEKQQLENPYDILRDEGENAVGRGTEAMVAYSELRNGLNEPEAVESLIRGLLSYCELDTLALVMIYMHWQEKLKEIRSRQNE
ncbi:DUF2779 domain-containing protein [Aliifodinibius sp. S!AR15-10]|uniref:DUF2779 domain-containing protein n=1 Tax=Aliifodinibius sp. S!AR15-10 TaxID=2950437 RepID=UPI002866FEC9|nr:DUF2779 domain-containing protein [Aliifodinibius sp. S!AR15-10]MDR8390329.1 DUF2779 domain-containing protein [Aliifodinibius sp. S!AR15-10]